MFKKRGGLAFKPKGIRRPPAAPIITPKASTSIATPDGTKNSVAGASVEAPSIPRTESQTNETSHTGPPPPTTTSDHDVPAGPQLAEKSSDARPQTEVTTPSAQDEPAPNVDTADTAPQPHDPPIRPVDISQPQNAPQASIEQEEPAPLATDIEKEIPAVPEPPAEAAEPESTPSTSASEPIKRISLPSASKDKTKEPSSDSSQPKKRQRRIKASQEIEEVDEAEEHDDDSQTAPKKRRRKSKEGDGKPRTRRARELTPEDAESQVVDHQKLTMADLTRDLHIGKKFSRHDELRDRERQARARSRLGLGKEDGEAGDTPSSAADSPNPTNAESTSQAAPPTPGGQQQGSGVQFRMVDGQIVLDQSSLVMDRHARAAAAQQDMETIEENDFTRLITSSSYMSSSKLKGPNIWTAEETVLFYRGLEMFGTDFQIIAQMFPNKPRRAVKLKFNREERHNPKLVDAALIGVKKTPMNIDEYKALTGGEFESVESIEAQHREQEEHFEARQKQLAEEQAEIMRKRKEELFADDDGNTGTGDGKKKKKSKGKKRQPDPSSLGDPEVVMDL